MIQNLRKIFQNNHKFGFIKMERILGFIPIN